MKPINFSSPERQPIIPYDALLACYKSGSEQMSEAQWEAHKADDPLLRAWLKAKGIHP